MLDNVMLTQSRLRSSRRPVTYLETEASELHTTRKTESNSRKKPTPAETAVVNTAMSDLTAKPSPFNTLLVSAYQKNVSIDKHLSKNLFSLKNHLITSKQAKMDSK